MLIRNYNNHVCLQSECSMLYYAQWATLLEEFSFETFLGHYVERYYSQLKASRFRSIDSGTQMRSPSFRLSRRSKAWTQCCRGDWNSDHRSRVLLWDGRPGIGHGFECCCRHGQCLRGVRAWWCLGGQVWCDSSRCNPTSSPSHKVCVT